jgi:hypothetical protein
MPRQVESTASMTEGSSAVPVGLFGEHRKMTSGWCSSTNATADEGASPKDGSRRAPIQRVPVPAASSGCIEYDGPNPIAVRPGPPNACSNCCCTSLDPFAAHTCAVVSPCPR